MASISITPASVLPGTGALIESGIAGETITAGMVLYYKPSDARYWKADSDATDPANGADGVVISLNGASAGQPFLFASKAPNLVFGGTGSVGADVWLADVAGEMTATRGDLEAGDLVVHLGTLTSATVLNFNPNIGGVIAA